jgi:hypothetical protein
VTYKLEGTPTDDQKERLEDWLQEMKLICRKYSLALTSEDEEVVVLDLASGNVVGIGIVPLTSGDPPYITAFDCAGSILDGVWQVDTPEGPRDQHLVTNVWPRRSPPGP